MSPHPRPRRRRAARPAAPACLAVLACLAAAGAARARDASPVPVGAPLAATPPTPGAPGGAIAPAPVPGPVQTQPQTQPQPQVSLPALVRYDALKPQGQTTDFPGLADTLLGNLDGFRTALYDDDLYAKVVEVDSLTDNVLPESGPREIQQYTGQRLTTYSNTAFRFSYALARSGTDLVQFNLCFADTATSFDLAGPAGVNFLRLDIYASLFDHRVEITAGEGGNILNYIGIFAGGNPILAAGLAGTIPIETGLSASPATTPLLNVQVNGDGGLYSKSGIQRSIGPDGFVSEAYHDSFGLAVTRQGAEPLLIEEFGLLRPATPDSRQIWVRAGGLYNFTRYTRFDRPGTDRNWSAYILGDYQVLAPDREAPYRGVFVGASALFAPDDVDVYTRTYEARVYAIGMVPGRPTDSGTVTFDWNDFSRSANLALEPVEPVEPDQWSLSGLYAVHLVRGLYLAPSVTYLHHPSFLGHYPAALNLAVALTAQF